MNGIATHPVLRISWDEAIAYCDWLDQQMKAIARQQRAGGGNNQTMWQGLAQGELRVILPSEAEWERAARYTDEREYPGIVLLPLIMLTIKKLVLTQPLQSARFRRGAVMKGLKNSAAMFGNGRVVYGARMLANRAITIRTTPVTGART